MYATGNDNREELKILSRLRRQSSGRMSIRYHIVTLYLKGYSKKQLAEIFGLSYHTIRNYIMSYETNGIEGLVIGKSTGAKRKLTPEQEKELYDCITTKLPKDVGFAPFANWTASLACQWVKERFSIEFSERGMRALFYRLNLSYTRPTYTLKKADPIKQDKFRADFEELKKKLILGDIDIILFQDESMIRDYQAISKTWFPKGEQKVIPTYGKHEGAKLVGTLNYETGRIDVEEHSKYDAEVFLCFLKNTLLRYPEGKIVIILDNAKIHHAKLLKDFLESNKARLTLKFLPPYSPNLNLIEELWGWLKNSVINNVFFKDVTEIKHAVRGFIDWVNTVPNQVIDRLCVQM